MPPKKGGGVYYKTKRRTRAAQVIQSAYRRRKKKVSSKVLRTSPNASPNVYHFTRGFDSFAFVDSNTGIFRQNTDNHYLIISLASKFSDLPDYGEFQALFNEYKIKNYSVKLIPNFTQNQYAVLNSADVQYRADIRNYQAFIVPVNYTDEIQDFSLMTGAQIDSWINQTQRKSSTIFPSRTKTYYTKNPMIVKYDGPTTKSGGTSTLKMDRPSWLSTSAPSIIGNPDERNVLHYGSRILIRRVDGSTLSGSANPMGWRVHHQVNFMTRKVQ